MRATTGIEPRVVAGVTIGGLYRHFKGRYYTVLDVAIHSETEELYVVYRPLYGSYQTFIRPLMMFLEAVDKEKYPEVSQAMRFTLVEGTDKGLQNLR